MRIHLIRATQKLTGKNAIARPLAGSIYIEDPTRHSRPDPSDRATIIMRNIV
jgi:hypothetical protein